MHVIHSGIVKADSNDLGSISYSVDIGILSIFLGHQLFDLDAHSQDFNCQCDLPNDFF